jgi:hypothetical protein
MIFDPGAAVRAITPAGWWALHQTKETGMPVQDVNTFTRCVCQFAHLTCLSHGHVNDPARGWVCSWHDHVHLPDPAPTLAPTTVDPVRPRAPHAFFEVATEGIALVARKNAGYAGAGDPWSNFRAGERLGVDGWKNALLRAQEKMNRVETLVSGRGQDLVGEHLRETMFDASNLLLIAICMMDESWEKS